VSGQILAAGVAVLAAFVAARRRVIGVELAAALVAGVACVGAGSPLVAAPAAVSCGLGAHVLGGRRRAARARARSAAILRDLPDALQLLAVAAGSGAPLPRAAAACARHVAAPLGDCLARAARAAEAPAGPRLSTALRREDPVLRPLAALVNASEELGTPLVAELTALAADERERRSRVVRRRAAEAAPRMMLVIGTLLAPAALLVIVGGEALAFAASLGGGRP
jgi:Flp pilus assembly protein TadB